MVFIKNVTFTMINKCPYIFSFNFEMKMEFYQNIFPASFEGVTQFFSLVAQRLYTLCPAFNPKKIKQ